MPIPDDFDPASVPVTTMVLEGRRLETMDAFFWFYNPETDVLSTPAGYRIADARKKIADGRLPAEATGFVDIAEWRRRRMAESDGEG